MTDRTALQKGTALLLPALLFGFLVTTQWATLSGAGDVAIRYIDPLTRSVEALQHEQTSLRGELRELRDRLDALQRARATQSQTAREIQARIEQLRVAAGLTEVRGEGVVIELAPGRPSGAAGEPERPPCLAPDLTDLVNLAWRGGAQAVAINGERLIASSSVYCIGATIVVNGGVATAPYAVQAIGTPGSIATLFEDPGQLRDLKRRRDQQAVGLSLSSVADLMLAPYGGALSAGVAVPR